MYSERHIITILNRIRRRRDILNCKGYFKLSTLQKYASGNYYKFFSIPKKNGGKRIISAPERELAFIQLCIAVLFNSIYKPNKCVFGFVDKRSIVQNAQQHINKEILFNIDLKDYFSSISYNDIIEKLIRQPYYFSYPAAKFLTDILVVETQDGKRVLPQGAPSSPIVTNMIADHLDVRLSKFAEKHDLTYTRYADDITFSFSRSKLRGWRSHGLTKGIRDIIFDIIETEGFLINKRKTRISFINQRHEVTGLVVNKKVNVKREYIKRLRTEIHNWERDGYVIASYKFLKHYEKTHLGKLKSMENVIEGKLSFIKMVKGENDTTFMKLYNRFMLLMQRDKVFINS